MITEKIDGPTVILLLLDKHPSLSCAIIILFFCLYSLLIWGEREVYYARNNKDVLHTGCHSE